ncbi:MAG: hypothetical protein LBK25_09515 [Treponema sp.]|nr:hypothetical protein [Treponema sp.]
MSDTAQRRRRQGAAVGAVSDTSGAGVGGNGVSGSTGTCLSAQRRCQTHGAT